MSGFDGRISIEGNKDLGRSLLGRAIKHANVQRQSKNILRQQSLTKAYDLGGGAYCVIVDLPHMRMMHIVAPIFTEAGELLVYDIPVYEGYIGPGVYDVLSGYTQSAEIIKETYFDEKGNKQTVKAIKQFKPTTHTKDRHPEDRYRRQRLAVTENPIFIPPNAEPGAEFSEHAHVKPSNYTGPMRRVVQLIMGLGHVIRPTAEEAKMPPLKPLLPIGTDITTKKPRNMISAFGLYGPHAGDFTPRVDFDYRWSRTHGVTLDTEAVAWVVEIGSRGVIAMRLYMDPVSQTKEGIHRWYEVSPELLDFLAEFSGIPLGITIPTNELFDKFVRAGEAIVLISERDMRVAYGKNPMSSDTGWTFSPNGKEAHNTCWTYGEDTVKRGYHYQISIRLQYEHFKPWTPNRTALAGMFSSLYEVNKCRRMTEEEAGRILKIYARDGKEAGDKAFDESVVTPTLTGSAGISMQRTGKLYHYARFPGQPQIKFPEHIVDALLSFDFSDGSDPPKRRTDVICDTPMYVAYINGGLEVINYAFDSATHEAPATEVSERGECQYEGDWSETSYNAGTTVVDGCFYSNRWDFRQERRTGGGQITQCSGGEIAKRPFWGQTFIFSSTIMVWTEVALWIDCVTKDYENDMAGERMLAMTAVQGDRNAYAMGIIDTDWPPNNTRYTGGVSVLRGEETEVWDVVHPFLAWVGSAATYCPKGYSPIDTGPLDCIARHRCNLIDPNACTAANVHTGVFWTVTCPAYPGGPFTWNGPKTEPWVLPPGYAYSVPGEGTVDSTVYFVNDTEHGERIVKHSFVPWDPNVQEISVWWARASPDEAGNMPHFKAVNSCLGEPVTNTMDDMDGDIIHIGGPEYMWAAWNACYTGVIE